MGDVPVRPLAFATTAKREPLVILDEGDAPSRRRPLSGEAAWQVARPKIDRVEWLFARDVDPDGRVRLYAGRGELSESVDPLSGSPTLLPVKVLDTARLGWCGECLAVAEGRSVRCFAAGKPRWEKEARWPIAAGPAMDEKNVFYADGRATWWPCRQPTGPSGGTPNCPGRRARASPCWAAACWARRGRACCWRCKPPTASRPGRWKSATCCATPRSASTGRLLAVSGANRLLVLDESSDGPAWRNGTWPTWLLAARIVGGRRVVCVDLRRQVTLLAWPSLETQETIAVVAATDARHS